MKKLLPLLLLFPLTGIGQVLYDFNTSGQVNAFNLTGPGDPGNLAWDPSGGIDDSGWLAGEQVTSPLLSYVSKASFDPHVTTEFTISTNFLWGDAPDGGNTVFGFGLAPTDDYVPTFATGDASGKSQTMVGLNLSGTNLLRLIGVSQDNGTSSGATFASPLFAPEPGDWYFLQTNYTFDPETDIFSIAVSLFNADEETGDPVGGTLQTLSLNYPNVALAAEGPLHVFFSVNADGIDRGFGGVDNFFAPVPEPSSAALLLIGLSAGSVVWFRKKSRRFARSLSIKPTGGCSN